MANLCLIPSEVEKFKTALKDKSINISDLLNMTTEERTSLLSKYVGENNATTVNMLFEEKLVLKNRIQGIKNWASKVGGLGKYSAEGKAALEKTISEYRAAQQQRIFSPKEHEAFLNDLADKKLGVHINPEQAQKVFDLTKAIQDTKENTDFSGMSPEHIQAKKDLFHFVNNIEAPTAVKSIAKNLAIIGRNNLLMNPATPLKTAIGQVVNSTIEAVSRKLANGALNGSVDKNIVQESKQEALDTYKKTGVNVTSMESPDDFHMLGKGENFNTPAQASNRAVGMAERAVSKLAQVSNKIIIDWAHNVPFTLFYQKTFFDSANIAATTLAKSAGDETRATEIYEDAMRVEPKTEQGKQARRMAQYQAARVTSTNNTVVSDVALNIKNALNKAGFPLGDFIMPIAKIPANIIANGIQNSGVGLFTGAKDIYLGRQKMASDDEEVKFQGAAQQAKGYQTLVRTIGSLGLAALIVSRLKKEDFREDNYGNHFVNIDGHWINTEYFAAISPAIDGMMSAKVAGPQGILKDSENFVTGMASPLRNAPGVNELNQFITGISTTGSSTAALEQYFKSFFSSRAIPMFLTNIKKSNPINKLFFGSTGAQSDTSYEDELKAKAKASAAKAKATKAAKK